MKVSIWPSLVWGRKGLGVPLSQGNSPTGLHEMGSSSWPAPLAWAAQMCEGRTLWIASQVMRNQASFSPPCRVAPSVTTKPLEQKQVLHRARQHLPQLETETGTCVQRGCEEVLPTSNPSRPGQQGTHRHILLQQNQGYSSAAPGATRVLAPPRQTF